MRIPSRVTTYAVGTTLALTGTLAATAAVAPTASADQTRASAAADWLAGELGSDGLLPGQYGGGDVGVSIDAGSSLAAIGGHDLDVTRIADAVSGQAGQDYVQYTYSSNPDGSGDQYAGQAANATGKALAFLESLPVKRSTAGTVDLRQRMEALTTDSGARRGRIVDVSTKNGTPDGQDYANTLGQAFAARGLAEAGSAEAPAALGYLLQQQCPGGGFRLAFPAPSAAQACTDKSAGAVDATSIAVAEIAQLPVTDATTRAIYRARAWLRGQQRVDGSFDGGTGTPGSNSNTTGLAAVALGTGDAAEAASTWVARRQVPAGQTGALAADKGAIAYDDAAKNAAATNGIGSAAADRDQWDRATAQAAGALLVVNPAHRALGLTGPSGYQRAGSTVTLDGSGLLAGRTAQLSGTGLSAYRTSTSSTWQQRVTLPAGTATRRYVLGEDTGLSAARSIKVLGTKKLAVAVSRYRVRRSHYVTATVSGLASGEKATISYRGSRVRSGAASTSGTFKATFRVGRSLGRKAVVGVGQFTDIRRGTGYVRVVR